MAEPAVPTANESTGSRLAELYAATAPGAVRLAFLLTGDRGVAEDIVQDAFIRVAGRLTHLRAPEAFDAYLRRAVVNLSKNHFRRRALERTFVQRHRPEEAITGPEPLVVEREVVMAALAELPPKQRAAIVLRYYEDLHEDSIADLLRVRPATVRSLVARGSERLRSRLGPPASASREETSDV